MLFASPILDFWANQTPLFRGKLLRHPNSPDLSDSLIPFSGSGKMVLSQKKKKCKSSSLTFMPPKREDRPKTGPKKKNQKKTKPGGDSGSFFCENQWVKIGFLACGGPFSDDIPISQRRFE